MSGGISLQDGIAELVGRGINLAPDTGRRLADYLGLLQKWNQVYNLTAVRDADRMVTHHLLDSLAVLPHLEARLVTRLLDVGSGAGLPGIPLALARPEWRVTVLDSNHKKGAFLHQAVAELGVPNVEVVITRVETFAPPAPYEVVISRAFSDLSTFAEATARLVAPGGRLVAMKGVFPHEEVDQVPSTVRVTDTCRIAVPGLPAERHLVVLEPA